MSSYPLFQAFPKLQRLPRAGLLQRATPVVPLGDSGDVWVKRDDLTAADYGGNKIRKLDLLLAAARAAGATDLVSFGYSGSNFVAATAWHGRKLGMTTHGFLLPQADASYVADNIATSLHSGAQLQVASSERGVVMAALARSTRLLLRQRRWPIWIPPGGSTALGSLGFVNAAFELKAQIEAGLLPLPERIYVAFSSMGTVAGLAIGLAMAGLRSRIVAVQVVDRTFADPSKLDRLIERTRALLSRYDALAAPSAVVPIEIRTEFFGEHYAVPTTATRRAIERFESDSGARADSAYSGKALAGLYADLESGIATGPALYWHTFNAHGRPPGVAPLAPSKLRAFLSKP
ncbi:pyridoxal-phosphate dependent enzyme [Sinimarinibacterium sp. CAU 1509]|uniref:1-aminocyclopropane-1-carboxylate deaminase/D-cysteine desulfhydrase n=1 Tax=Sinimarinibacterium sp. CAU 1509 TaxID=2562283 RepID=UPI0010ABB3AA|nr:pyridoxal-phosphate dependent enzyme [Sinimarinibacterium sp. CAU 1509]TJY59300.1 pyridoxal-phosphate dependent enzyme [Sinimarinibacterium sp. CAU 1509]